MSSNNLNVEVQFNEWWKEGRGRCRPQDEGESLFFPQAVALDDEGQERRAQTKVKCLARPEIGLSGIASAARKGEWEATFPHTRLNACCPREDI